MGRRFTFPTEARRALTLDSRAKRGKDTPMAGYLRHYARLGYQDGRKALAKGQVISLTEHNLRAYAPHCAEVCKVCECSFSYHDENPCECGCAEEYDAARKYVMGSGEPVRVYVYLYGSRQGVRPVDAWDARSAMRAARYLKGYTDGAVCFSYSARSDAWNQ